MKANSDKSHILLSCNEPSKLVIDGSSIETNTKQVLRGITVDKDLKFDDHVNRLSKKVWQKRNVLARLASYMNIEKRRIIIKAFIESQFEYCPLVWIFLSQGINNKINQIHERALRITYNNKSSSFQDLLDKDNSVTIHHRNIRTLFIEILKVLHRLSPPLLNEVFMERNCKYSLLGNNFLKRRRVNSVRYGTESVSFLAPKIWDTLPKEIKNSETLNAFTAKIKNWVPHECPCRHCNTYVWQVGFV